MEITTSNAKGNVCITEEAIASIEMPSVDGLATESYVDNAIANIEHPTVDLEPYAKKTDLPSLEGLATESYVDNKVSTSITAALTWEEFN